MVCETTNSKLDPLLPDRHPQPDLFICDVADAVLKDVMHHMEHPFYSLSKKPETKVRRYEHNGNWIEIVPSVKGLATIYDKDILIYCISQIMAKLKKGEKVSQRVKITTRDLLVFTNRGTSGRDYMALRDALDRLDGTRIRTNIKSGGVEKWDAFGLIDAASLTRKNGLDGRLLSCEVVLSDWVFSAIRNSEVLTLHPDYFRLRKPLERRVYEIARKHCGQKQEWKLSLKNLLKKSGAQSPTKVFKQMLKGLEANNHLPDYEVRLENEMVFFNNRNTFPKKPDMTGKPMLSGKAIQNGRRAAPGYDIYVLERQWIEHWNATGRPKLENPEGAFVGFCKSVHKRNPIDFQGSFF